MINNFQCVNCFFQDKCVAYKKLNAFSSDARTDLGVILSFIACDKYIKRESDEEE